MDLDLKTRRLHLRPPRPADAPAIARYIGDWDVARMLARVPVPYRLSDAQAWIESHQGDTQDVVVLLSDLDAEDPHAVFGAVGMHWKEDGARFSLGYWLARARWGEGLMSEAAGALVDHFFRTRDIADMESGHFAENGASGRILTKLGFERTGEHRAWSPARARYLPHVDVVLTRERRAALVAERTRTHR